MKNSKSIYPLIILFLIGVFAVSCSSDDDGTTNGSNSSYKNLGIRAVNTGTEDLEISYGDMSTQGAQGFEFCYEGMECEHSEGGGSFWINPNMASIIIKSSSDKEGQVIGVKANLQIDAGSGYIEVVRGRVENPEDVFPEFEVEGEPVYTTETFSEGDLIEFSWGETN